MLAARPLSWFLLLALAAQAAAQTERPALPKLLDPAASPATPSESPAQPPERKKEDDKDAPPAMALHEAAKAGLIAAVVTGLGNSTGDALQLRIQRRKPEPLRITLTPGTVFVPARFTVQSMAGLSIRGGPIVLDDDEPHTYIIEAYCLDFGKGNPQRSDSFMIERVDRSVGAFLKIGERYLEMRTLQTALWVALHEDDAWEIQDHFDIRQADLLKAVVFVEQLRQRKLPPPPDQKETLPFIVPRSLTPAVPTPSKETAGPAPATAAPAARGFGGPARGFEGAPQRGFATPRK